MVKDIVKYIDSIDVHRVENIPSEIVSEGATYSIEEGYGEHNKELYKIKLCHPRNSNMDEILQFSIYQYDERNNLVYYQYTNDNLSGVKSHYVSWKYDDKNRLIYYKLNGDESVLLVPFGWEKYKYVDMDNQTHLTYRNSFKKYQKITYNNHNEIIHYEDEKSNWFDKEHFPDMDCPFKLTPLKQWMFPVI